jgi:outer membrane protein TolC
VLTYEARLQLEQSRLLLTRQSLEAAERRFAVGIDRPEALLDARARVAEAEAALKLVELDLAEVRLTSQEPVASASAPLVSGRDFVSERWQVELTVPQAALELERRQLKAAEVRVDVGLARSEEVDAAAQRAFEVEAAIVALQQKLRIRQLFLKGLASAPLTDLRVLEAEAEQRRMTVERRIEAAARQVKDMEVRVQIGTSAPLEVSGARLRLQELQLALTKAAYDLDLIREQIRKHRE